MSSCNKTTYTAIGTNAIAPPLSNPEQASILQISKTHLVVLQMINQSAAIGQSIQKTAIDTGNLQMDAQTLLGLY